MWKRRVEKGGRDGEEESEELEEEPGAMEERKKKGCQKCRRRGMGRGRRGQKSWLEGSLPLSHLSPPKVAPMNWPHRRDVCFFFFSSRDKVTETVSLLLPLQFLDFPPPLRRNGFLPGPPLCPETRLTFRPDSQGLASCPTTRDDDDEAAMMPICREMPAFPLSLTECRPPLLPLSLSLSCSILHES